MEDNDLKRPLEPQALSQHSRSSLSALDLAELRAKLPTGGPGSIINSYIFPSHPHAITYQRALHVEMVAQQEVQEPRLVCPMVALICSQGYRRGTLCSKIMMDIDECSRCDMVGSVYIEMDYNVNHS